MSEKIDFIVCARVDDPQSRPVLGAKRRWCRRCNEAVYIAPSGWLIVKKRGAGIICIQCWAKDESLRQQPPMKLTPEQIKEIADALENEP